MKSTIKMFLLMILVGCASLVFAQAAMAYQIIVTKSGTAGGIGTVTSVPAGINCGSDCSENYLFGSYDLSALAGPGSTFTGWSGGGCSGTHVCTLTDVTAVVTANFNYNLYSTSAQKTGIGGIFSTGGTFGNFDCGVGDGPVCNVNFMHTDRVTITAIPAPGYYFAGWNGTCAPQGLNPTCTIQFLGPGNTVWAIFKLLPVLTTTMNGSGKISGGGIDCPATNCSTTETYNASVALTATPNPGYAFVGWGGDCAGTGICNLTMDADKSVNAIFGYALTVNNSGNGTVTGSGINCGAVCSSAYISGTTVTLTATPSPGYSFSGWSGACTGTGACSLLMNSAKSVTATFTQNASLQYLLNVSKTGNGTVNGGVINCGATCGANLPSGSSITLQAVPDFGYSFSGWSGACSGTGYCSLNMDSDKTVTARFQVASATSYSLAVSSPLPTNGTIVSSGGSGSNLSCGSTCSVTKSAGDTVTLMALPDAGYIFNGWGGDCAGTADCVLSMTGNKTVSATFSLASAPPVVPSSGNPLNPCWDILYNGKAVLKDGVPNSGIMQFDPTGGLPARDYEACMWAPDNDALNVIYGKGWLWDTNLGWISMYCGDEDNDSATPYTNLGIPCGDFAYGVWMEGYAGQNKGRLHGFAWGDNVGYISFNCEETGTCQSAPYYVQPDVTTDPWNPNSACLGYVNKTGCFPTGAIVSHAWSDNVGWLDLTGVRFPWFQIINAPVLVSLKITPDPLMVNKHNAPVADNNDSYKMDLKLTKIDGVTPININDYTVRFVPTWRDSVSMDQTEVTAQNCDAAAQGGNCAVSKPLSLADFGSYDQLTGTYTAYVKSLAPTSSMNGYAENSDNLVDFKYDDFVVIPQGVSKPPTHDLVLENIQASVVRNADGFCSYGAVAGNQCGMRNVGAGSINFGFTPAIEVATLADSINNDTITASYSVPNKLQYSTVCRGVFSSGCGGATVDFRTSVDSHFKLVYDDDAPESEDAGADCHDPNMVSIPTNLGWAALPNLFALTPVFTDDGAGGCLTEGPPTAKDPTIYSVVTQPNSSFRDSKYYSNKLPRKTGAVVYNPVATIKGSVYSTGVSNPQTNVAYRSLGDISTNVLRETIAKNVYSLIAGVKEASGGPGDITISDSLVAVPAGKINTLLNDDSGLPRVLYSNGHDVVFDNGSNDIRWTGERTVIVIGANVYINSNIYVDPASGVTPKPKLGIIVLKDEQFKTGGNIYVGPNVTNIQANIYADGSLFSYVPGTGSINANGEPMFESEERRHAVLQNQLFIEGSLASQNTIGGAVYNPNPILGDGTVVSADEGQYGTNPSGRSRARLYDLNFLRYYGLVYERDADGNALDKNKNGTLDPEAYPDGDMIPNPAGTAAKGLPDKSYAPEYILFDPPTPTLPGFGAQTGAEVKIGPQ
jgi:hypothetical protein